MKVDLLVSNELKRTSAGGCGLIGSYVSRLIADLEEPLIKWSLSLFSSKLESTLILVATGLPDASNRASDSSHFFFLTNK